MGVGVDGADVARTGTDVMRVGGRVGVWVGGVGRDGERRF